MLSNTKDCAFPKENASLETSGGGPPLVSTQKSAPRRFRSRLAANRKLSALPSRTDSSQLVIAVGTAVAGCPPHGSGRALLSASGSYLG
jgi:hypothetical protein